MHTEAGALEKAQKIADMIEGIKFDVTGHPPRLRRQGSLERLPFGMILVSRHWQDGTGLRVAHAFQTDGGV